MQKESKQLIIILLMIIVLIVDVYLQSKKTNIENSTIIIENDTVVIVEDTLETINYIDGVEVEIVPRVVPQAVI